MNRRSFIAGVLTALVAPAILVPKCPDRQRWKYRRHRYGFYIAEYRFAIPPNIQDQEWVFYKSTDFGLEEQVRPPAEELNKPGFVDRCTFRNKPIPRGEWRFVEWHGPPSFVPGAKV